MSAQSPIFDPAGSEPAWSGADSAELYRTASWGAQFFFVNKDGHVAVNAMNEAATTMDLVAIVDELRRRGVQFPVLLRFQDVLRARVKRLNEAFRNAIEEAGYGNDYRAVYPIKVNQLHEVVDELLDAGKPYGMGLECGSKAEFIAALPQLDDDTLLVCNGVKDKSMLSLMISGQRLGRNAIPVIENYSEFVDLKGLAFNAGFVPRIGVRVRLATPGSGRWSDSSGVNSKFGLSVAELLSMLRELEASGLSDRLMLLHCHIGSQIADIQVLKQAAKEVTRIYAELISRGAGVEYLDLGGGLGVNYDRDHLEEDAGINYSLQEYANAVVFTVHEICAAHGVAEPILVTESGRALTAHHSVLIVPVLGTRSKDDPALEFTVGEGASEPVQALNTILSCLDSTGTTGELLEAYHNANARLDEVRSLFTLGYLDLEQRALAESLYWRLCSKLLAALKMVPGVSVPEVAELERQLTDLYQCDFSIFQSMLDHWAIGQPFPIMPINRLDERPTRRGVLVDLTCDSDGRVSHYVSANADNSFLPVHAPNAGEPYYLAFFLMGAYEDIVGDAHNLFGRVSEAHIYADPDEPDNFWIEKIIPGTAIQDMLAQVQYFPNDLHRRMSELVRAKINAGVVRPTQGIAILDQYMACFPQNTYCNPRDMEQEAPS
ncbi:biosynthetic arginine decarboxylase [Candidatus Rariloculus sp.]|uniref:biosynthetic arginine decarboxylase n=1 Tax=Candidatus Rariloculus sp. TaxID=3101265 RepID=UPI003D0F3B43